MERGGQIDQRGREGQEAVLQGDSEGGKSGEVSGFGWEGGEGVGVAGVVVCWVGGSHG